jgi:medium-chain acyl-[acyl-carrier-protein] hydrolase
MIGEIAAAWQGSGPYTFAIRGTDTDWRDRLHLFSLFSFMQESAYANAEAGGLGSSFLDRQGFCWMLIRISVRMNSLPKWGETLTVKTWSRGCRKLTFLRDYEFFSSAGEQIGSASSEWLIGSSVDHRPQRPDSILADRRLPEDSRAVFPEPIQRPPRLPENPEELPVLTVYADFSDIDRNGHVNNTRYVAWCLNALHAAIQPACAEVRCLDIHYVNEVRRGDKILVWHRPGDLGEHFIEARRAVDDAVVFRARANSEQL